MHRSVNGIQFYTQFELRSVHQPVLLAYTSMAFPALCIWCLSQHLNHVQLSHLVYSRTHACSTQSRLLLMSLVLAVHGREYTCLYALQWQTCQIEDTTIEATYPYANIFKHNNAIICIGRAKLHMHYQSMHNFRSICRTVSIMI